MVDICPWPCMVSPVPVKSSSAASNRSFAQVVNDACDVKISQLPVPAIRGEDLCIKITQHEYEKGLADCKKNLHGRLVMNKGDKPLSARELSGKLSSVWKTANQWKMISLGRGFYEFQFVSFEDMRLAWSMGTINLKPGVLRLSKWTNDFNPYTQRQTHTQIWIRLMELPQEYWRQCTLFEIASAIGTPLSLDEATKARAFGHYARILVDMDLSRHVFDEIVVEREGYSFKLAVVYERLPAFCMHCGIIGHSVQDCNWLKPSEAKVDNRAKKIITIKKEAANMQYIPKKKDNAFPSTAEVVEVETNQQSNLRGSHEGIKQNEEQEAGHYQAHEGPKIPSNDNGANANDGVVVQHSTSFSMTLNNVQDDIVLGDIQIDDPVLQQVTTDNVAGVTPINEDLDHEEKETDDNSSNVPDTQLTFVKQDDAVEVGKVSVPNDFDAPAFVLPGTMQNIMILPDDEFDEAVQADLQVIKQAWAAMEKGEKSFTPVISKSQKKKIKQLARSVGQSCNTRSKGDTSH
ncbi:hypothetical protein QL285_095068 [Trifolium repens]|nr:hypothetical protein QL285_095068 [Trifolium repens]